VIRYAFEGGDTGEELGIFAKMRSRGPDVRTQRLLVQLRQAGLDHARGSRVGVPAAVGVVPELALTLQSACPGEMLTLKLISGEVDETIEHVADGLARLHDTVVNTTRTHTIEDELDILNARLREAWIGRPGDRARIDAIEEACNDMARGLVEGPPRGLHRDFYPDQVLVDGDRLSLLDLDLYALGDCPLDVGNFVAHLTELSLRTHARPDRFSGLERRFEVRYCERMPEVTAEAIRVYRILTLARHIRLSMIIEGRESTTHRLIDQCERELAEFSG
jgi:Ser/Thr protein kinase RdoA (MazF antagonist)